MNQHDEHCCDQMRWMLSEPTGVAYNPMFREYGIVILDGGSSVMTMKHCPWCAARLPDALRERWFERLDTLGLEPEDAEVPDAMRSDRWWKEEGL
jgi:hypothetical protein